MARACLLLAFAARLALATSCAELTRPCEALVPGMIVFIGTVVHVEKSKWSSMVTFAVNEPLWGVDEGARTLTVDLEYDDSSDAPRFIAAKRNPNGHLFVGSCTGIELDADHPWVHRFREQVRKRNTATLPVRVVSDPNFVAIASAEIRIEGNGKEFTGRSNHNGRFEVSTLPPGTYRIWASMPNYSLKRGPSEISVLPGGCGATTVRLTPSVDVSGRVVDHLGRPVPNLEGFDLLGWDMAEQQSDYRISRSFRTDENGEFRIEGVLAGTYYLAANAGGQNQPRRSTLPQVFYPGTREFKAAIPIIVSEGDKLNELTFHLPDFGAKRRLQVKVIGKSGEPVPDALIENGPAQNDNRTTAAIKEKKTDSEGIAFFEIWEIAWYSIAARWNDDKSFRQSAPVSIPAGQGPVNISITLR